MAAEVEEVVVGSDLGLVEHEREEHTHDVHPRQAVALGAWRRRAHRSG
jgi:hypothetical protein